MDLKASIEHLTNMGPKRESILKVGDGSGRRLLYDDDKRAYFPLERYVHRDRVVSNVESFATMVKEEARRIGSDGDCMTVVFNQTGGEFHLDDRVALEIFKYERELSPQWQLLSDANGNAEPHPEFIRLLQNLRPSLTDYVKVMSNYRSVTLAVNQKFESAPALTQGSAGFVYKIECKVGSGPYEGELKPQVDVFLQYARGSERRYTAELEVAVELNESTKKLTFALVWADREAIAEQAIVDEIKDFRSLTTDLPKLSILENY